MINIRENRVRSLLGHALPKELEGIVNYAPVKITTTYEELDEVVSVMTFPELGGSVVPELYVSCLGNNPQKATLLSEWKKIPELRIYELRDVIVYNGHVLSQRGEVLYGSLRVFDENLERFNSPYALDNNYIYLIKTRHRLSVERHTESTLNFCTYHHFGHYLAESLNLLWATDHADIQKLLLSPQFRQDSKKEINTIPQYLCDMVAPFGFSQDSFTIAKSGFFEKLYLPTRPYMHFNYTSDIAKSVYRKVAEYYAGKAKFPRKIYISRAGIKKRKLLNEHECEDIFRQRGFSIIKPELLSFPEQVNLFAHATHVAGPVGSGMHGVLFALQPDTVRTLLLAPAVNQRLHPYAAIECFYGREPCAVIGDYSCPPGKTLTLDTPWMLSEKKLPMAIEQWLDW